MAKNFKVGDLVWAKMKGYPPWPGEIMEPPSIKSSKSKKLQHYVLFFGSNNHAWIPDENILEHNQKLIEEHGSKRKIPTFQKAIHTIVEKSRKNGRKQTESEGAASPKFKDPDGSFETHPSEMSQEKRNSNNEVKRKFPAKKGKESSKKRTFSPNPSEPESVSITENAARYEDVYRDLIQNIPPNIELDIHAIRISPGGFLARTYVERPETPPLDLLSESAFLEARHIKPTNLKIGFLGLGKLGQGIVKNLGQSGHSLIIWNRTTEKCRPFAEKLNIEVASTPADVVIAADVTFCCVSDEKAARALVFGNCGVVEGLQSCTGLKKGYIEMTSMDASSSQDIADKIRLIGGRYLEAPIKGSRIEANEGTLLIHTAGDKSLYDECKSCFDAICKTHKYLSADVGYAAKIHLVHSMFMGTVYCSMAEVLALAVRAKVDVQDLLEVFKHSILEDETLLNKGKAMIENNYANQTSLKHVQKDLNLGLMLGSSVEQPTPVIAAVNEVFKHCRFLRYGDHDVSAVFEGTKP